jgi:HTH-type transcriptional regulator, competence development regulator
MRKGRAAKVILSPEARVLRHLRTKQDLSMRQAGELIGFSDSYISHIENGRENPPRGEKLLRFLKVYGDISIRYFEDLCRNQKNTVTDLDHLQEVLPKLKQDQLRLIRTMVDEMLKT